VGLHVLVLAGGSGTRLWPLSRGALPKHLLPLAPRGQTLLRATVDRVLGLGDSVSVVTSASQAELCQAELTSAGLGTDAVIAEPVARGTGPALGLAVASIAHSDPEALIASVHADHRVADAEAYRAAVLASAGWAAATGGLATVGITPTGPATGLGYIEIAKPVPASNWRSPSSVAPPSLQEQARNLPAFAAAGFAEKPSAEVAEAYVTGGRHLWNLGLFAWPAAFFLDELRRADAAMASSLDRIVAARAGGDEATASQAYAALRTVAVEPLVLERTSRLTVVQAGFAWSDVGSWSDLHQARVESGEADADGNVIDGEAIVLGARDSTVVSRAGRLVAVVGTEGLVVVDTPKALLVVPAAESQKVKDLVDRLRAEGRKDLL
jgi:mannose-1-phosphate guanylyltransferase